MVANKCTTVDRALMELAVLNGLPERGEFFDRALGRAGFARVDVHPLGSDLPRGDSPNGSERRTDVVVFSADPRQDRSWTMLEELRRNFHGPIVVAADSYEEAHHQRLAELGVNDRVELNRCSATALPWKLETALLAHRGEKVIDDNDRRNQSLFINILTVMVKILDSKDRYTRWHSHNVAIRSRKLGRILGLSEDELDRLGLAAVFHDFGKIGISEAILNKAGKLTDEEFAAMRRHPVIARDLLSSLDLVRDLLPAILHHHEDWNGRGYPDGLAGEQIPLWARIIRLADTYDTMSARRVYKEPFSRDKVVKELKHCSGKQFDPNLVPLFLEIVMEEEYQPHPGYKEGQT